MKEFTKEQKRDCCEFILYKVREVMKHPTVHSQALCVDFRNYLKIEKLSTAGDDLELMEVYFPKLHKEIVKRIKARCRKHETEHAWDTYNGKARVEFLNKFKPQFE